MKTFNRRVYEIVAQIPAGKVMSYGQIARLVGNPMASRAVGYAMHGAVTSAEMPCHRVVFRDGALSPAFPVERQYRMLKAEKVSFLAGKKVDMARHRWDARKLRVDFI